MSPDEIDQQRACANERDHMYSTGTYEVLGPIILCECTYCIQCIYM